MCQQLRLGTGDEGAETRDQCPGARGQRRNRDPRNGEFGARGQGHEKQWDRGHGPGEPGDSDQGNKEPGNRG